MGIALLTIVASVVRPILKPLLSPSFASGVNFVCDVVLMGGWVFVVEKAQPRAGLSNPGHSAFRLWALVWEWRLSTLDSGAES